MSRHSSYQFHPCFLARGGKGPPRTLDQWTEGKAGCCAPFRVFRLLTQATITQDGGRCGNSAVVVARGVGVNHAHVDGQAPTGLPRRDEDVGVPFEIPGCGLFAAVGNGTGLQTPAQERLNAKVSLPELVPLAADHVVAESVHRRAAGQGAGGALKGCWDEGDT